MTTLRFSKVLLLAGCVLSCAAGSGTTQAPAEITLVRAFPSLTFSQPLDMHQAPNGGRWYVVERGGRILNIADNAASAASTSLDISGRVSTAGEGGLLGMAFSPSFSGSGDVFLSYTSPVAGAALLSVVSRWHMASTGIVAPDSESLILTVRQPYTNHNGGCIAFGPEGLLYIGLGDGGSAGDPQGNGQDTTTVLGKLLRIDVTMTEPGLAYAIPSGNVFAASATNAREIFAWGFRNPWRFSFDRQTPNSLWVGDVGQNTWEEIDIVLPGQNYGWNVMEGVHCYPPGAECNPTGFSPPVAEYGHDQGDSVTGGYVYRGAAVASLVGTYLFGDYGSGRIWGLPVAGPPYTVRLLADTNLAIASFAQDVDGELYVLDISGGTIWKIGPAVP